MGGNGLFKNKRKIDYKKIKMIIMNLWLTYDYFKIQYWKDWLQRNGKIDYKNIIIAKIESLKI